MKKHQLGNYVLEPFSKHRGVANPSVRKSAQSQQLYLIADSPKQAKPLNFVGNLVRKTKFNTFILWSDMAE